MVVAKLAPFRGDGLRVSVTNHYNSDPTPYVVPEGRGEMDYPDAEHGHS